MRRRLAFILVAGALALAALRIALWQPRALVASVPDDGYLRVPGIVHVHTTFSDGSGTPDEVIRAARAAAARFVVITDHNNADAKPLEGEHDGVLAIVGTEVSTTAGHILGLGIRTPTYRFSGDALDTLMDIRDLGGFAVAAHPLNPRADLRFTGWDLPGPWGIELLNGDSEWRSAGLRNLLTIALYGLNKRYALSRVLTPPDATLARWDQLLAGRDVAGLAGTDAHGFPSYESLFGLVRNYVLLPGPLTGRFEDDRGAVLAALRRGSVYLGVDALANADGFSFVAEWPGHRVTMGETAPPVAGLRLKAGGRLPRGARILLVRDGKRMTEAEGALDAGVRGPGVYRIEVRIPGTAVPWILSNPIYVFDAAAQAARARRAAWPSPSDVPQPAAILDDFDRTTAFQAAADSLSSVRSNVLDPGGGRNGSGAARLEFHVGEPTPDHADVFAALIDRTPRDLRARAGLTFSVRADGVYRMWVQVRDENIAAGDGVESWFMSARTSTEWQRIDVPFARLRSIDPKTDGRLDLGKIRALVFVLDRGSVTPGTRGTIWLDDLGVY